MRVSSSSEEQHKKMRVSSNSEEQKSQKRSVSPLAQRSKRRIIEDSVEQVRSGCCQEAPAPALTRTKTGVGADFHSLSQTKPH